VEMRGEFHMYVTTAKLMLRRCSHVMPNPSVFKMIQMHLGSDFCAMLVPHKKRHLPS